MTIIRGPGGIQKRAIRKDGWTKERRAGFLDMLAATCHVVNSAKSVGMNQTTAHDLRRSDPEFAQRWAEAIAMGRERLEQELLAYSLGQMSSGDNPGSDRKEIAPTPMDAKTALDVLKTLAALERRSSGGRPAAVMSEAEVNALLAERLEDLHQSGLARLATTAGAVPLLESSERKGEA